jgi:hypothetical protein
MLSFVYLIIEKVRGGDGYVRQHFLELSVRVAGAGSGLAGMAVRFDCG